MRTLLVSLAFMVMVSGCAMTVPCGMENMGSIDQFRRDSGNSTQITEKLNESEPGEVLDAAFRLVVNVFGL